MKQSRFLTSRTKLVRISILFSWGLLLLGGSHALSAPPKLEYLFPAGVGRGTTARITVAGSFENWPPGCWVDTPGVNVEAADEKGKLTVEVDPNVDPGRYWMRFYDQTGATSLRPLQVGSLPEHSEIEPNNRIEQAQQLPNPIVLNGQLATKGDVDCFALELKRDQTLVASMAAHQLGSPMDGVLQICSADGFVLLQNDDEIGLDPQIVFVAPHDATYLVRTFAFPSQPNSSIAFAGGASYVYRLTMTTSGFLSHALPLAVNRDSSTTVQLRGWNLATASIEVGPPGDRDSGLLFAAECAGSLAIPYRDHGCIVAEPSSGDAPQQIGGIPVSITGQLSDSEQRHHFQFQAAAGDKVRFDVYSQRLGYRVDPYAQLFDEQGELLAKADDTSGSRDPVFDHQFKAAGTYRLVVQDRYGHAGPRHVYRLDISKVVPDFSLSLENDRFEITAQGDPLEIPVNVNRADGFQQSIRIEAIGLPDGIEFEPVDSLAEGDSAKKVTLKLRCADIAPSGTFRLVGQTVVDQSSVQKHASFRLGDFNDSHSALWLTVLPVSSTVQATTTSAGIDASADKKRPSADSTGPAWKAGVAQRNITPKQLMWMAGYGARDHPAEGKLTDLWAKALVLEDAEDNRAVLITMDLVGIDRGLSMAICQSLEQRYNLKRHQIAICLSHTHSGPVVGRNLEPLHYLQVDQAQQKLIDQYADELQGGIVQLVGDAMQRVSPCRVSWGNGQATFAVNRRNNNQSKVPELRAAGQLQGPVDYDVPVLAIRDVEGDSLRAIVFGYACHATVLSSYQWSGDYPGEAQIELEKSHPNCVAMFWAGCGADLNPLPRREVELAQDYGRQLASAVDRVLAGVMPEVLGTLATRYSEVALPLAPLPTAQDLERDAMSKDGYVSARAKMLLQRLEAAGSLQQHYPYPIGVWSIGQDVRFVTLGGEVVVDYALRLKDELNAQRTWVAGYSHDVMAYIPSRRVLREGGYEGGGAMVYYGLPTVWAPDVERIIVQAVHDLVAPVPAPR